MTTADRLPWRTPSRSSNGENCVEVAPTAVDVHLRHSKHPEAGTIRFSYSAWQWFVREASDGAPAVNGVAAITRVGQAAQVRSFKDSVELRFDPDEWSAFVSGVVDGEFDFGASTPPLSAS